MAKSRNRKLADLIVTAGVDIAGNVTFDGGSTSADLTFADGDKANFGASSDLQIYHTGSASYIEEKGQGSLYIRGTQLRMQATDGTTYLEADDGGALTIKHSGATKLATTSTGVNVTGITTSDTLVLEGTGVNTTYFTGGDASVSGRQLTLSSEAAGGQNNATHRLTVPSGYGSFNVTVNAKERVKINNNGDVSFYNDASSNAVKMFWDASAERLGIGTTAPLSALNVKGTQGQWRVDPDSVSNHVEILSTNTANTGFLNLRLRTNDFIVQTGGTDRLTLNSSGNATFTGTISSGAITSSAAVSANSLSATSSISTGYGLSLTNGSTNYLLYSNTGNDTLYMRDQTNSASITAWNPTNFTVYKALSVTGNATFSGSVTASDEFRAEVVAYSSNQDAPYLIAGTSGYTGATTNWNTFGFQHRIKSNSGGTPRITVDNYNGELFSVDNNGAATFTGSVTSTGLTSAGTILATSSTTINTILRGGDGNSKNLVFQKTTGSAQQAKISAVGDDLRFTTGTTTERMRIDSSGNVGIGTAAPTARLDVRSPNGGVHSRGQLYLTNTDSHAINQGSQISLGGTYSGTSDTYLGSIAARKENATSGDYAGYLQFGTRPSGSANVERMRITSTGNVGIGNVVSQAYVNEGTYTTKLRVGSDTSGTDNASAVQIVGKDATGNGILGVIEFLNHRDNDVVAKIAGRRDLGSSSYLGAGQLDFSTDDGNGNLDIRMSIDANGNVGIGTTAPGATLDLRGDMRLDGSSGTDRSIYFRNQGTVGGQVKSDKNISLWAGNGSGSATQYLTIKEGGNVGIGTTAPSAVLSLYDPDLTAIGTGLGGLRVHRPAAQGQYGYFDYSYGGGGVNIGSFYSGGGASIFGTFTFRQHSSTTSQVPMFINNTGNVGIGLTNPAHKLQVNGNAMLSTADGFMYLSNVGTGNSGIYVRGIGGSNILRSHSTGQFTWEVTGSEKMRLTSGGNVGIGTSSPSYKFDVYGTDDITMRIHRPSSGLAETDTCGIGFSHRGDTTTSTSDTRAGIFSTYNGSLYLCTEPGGNLNSNPVDHAALSIVGTTQYVGIGTSSPAGPLHVDGHTGSLATILEGNGNGDTVPLHFRVKANNNDVTNHGIFGNAGSTGADNFIHIGPSSTSGISVMSSGNVGIGASPTAPLQISGSPSNTAGNVLVSLKDIDNAIEFGLRLDSTSKDLHLDRYYSGAWQSTPVMSFDRSSGNVGIGTTAPTSALEVNGTIRTDLIQTTTTSMSALSFLNLDMDTGASSGTNNVALASVNNMDFLIDTNNNGTTGAFVFGTDANTMSSATELMRLNESGSLGIGGTPDDAKLQVFGNAFIGSAASNATIDDNLTTGGLDVAVGNGTKAFQVWDDNSTGTPRFIVERAGNVGIGTTSPGAKLEVNGNTTIQNNVKKYNWGGNTRSDYTLSFSVPNIAGIMHIRAMWTHHASSHGCLWEGYIYVYPGHAGIQTTTNNINQTSTNGGSWTVTRGAANSDVVIAKTAGTYAGNGEYSVEVTHGISP